MSRAGSGRTKKSARSPDAGSARPLRRPNRREPVQQRSRERVQRLLGAARTILERDGLDALTSARIAKEAAVPVGSFYQYFPNKEAVLIAFYQDYLRESFEMLQKADAAASRARDWREYIALYVRYTRAHELRDTFVIELFAAIRSFPELEEIDAAYTEQVADFLVSRFLALGARAPRARLRRAACFAYELNNAAWAYQIRAGDGYVERETTEWLAGAIIGALDGLFDSKARSAPPHRTS